MITVKPLQERFESKFSTCWIWQGAKCGEYGHLYVEKRDDGRPLYDYAHRISYRLYKGEIPEGYEVKHLCDTPACVNPDHLDVDTHQGNIQDREARGRGYRREGVQHPELWKPFCTRGHDRLDPNNLYNGKNGKGRQCKLCMKIRNDIRQAKIVAARQM